MVLGAIQAFKIHRFDFFGFIQTQDALISEGSSAIKSHLKTLSVAEVTVNLDDGGVDTQMTRDGKTYLFCSSLCCLIF